MKKIVSIDVGGTFIKYGLLDNLGNIFSSGKIKTDRSRAESFINQLCEIIKSYNNISGVAISIPGFVNNKLGIIVSCSPLKFIENYNIKDILEKKCCIPVTIENDANCVALAEKFNGNAVECDDFICITIGTGIGGGIFLNGKLVRGKQFKGGEFCYMITSDKEGYQRTSQNASMTALINMYKDYKGIVSNKEIFGDEVFMEAESNDEINNIINQWYGNIARMIYNVSSILNPEKILIGGGVSAREELVNMISLALNEIPTWNLVQCKVEKCKNENNAGLIGAVYNFLGSN